MTAILSSKNFVFEVQLLRISTLCCYCDREAYHKKVESSKIHVFFLKKVNIQSFLKLLSTYNLVTLVFLVLCAFGYHNLKPGTEDFSDFYSEARSEAEYFVKYDHFILIASSDFSQSQKM